METLNNKIAEVDADTNTTYLAAVPVLEMNLLYSMMLLRISKGYSTHEVSFLMGYAYDIMGEHEQLQHPKLAFLTLYQLFVALEGQRPKGFVWAYEGYGDAPFECRLLRTDHGTRREHALFMTDNTGKEAMVFKLFEQKPAYIMYADDEERGLRETRAILQLIFDGGIFYEPQTPLEIFSRCRLITDLEMRPRHLMQVLTEMTAKRGNPKLMQRKARRDGMITFEKYLK